MDIVLFRCASTTLVSLIKLLGRRHNFGTFSSRVFFKWEQTIIFFHLIEEKDSLDYILLIIGNRRQLDEKSEHEVVEEIKKQQRR